MRRRTTRWGAWMWLALLGCPEPHAREDPSASLPEIGRVSEPAPAAPTPRLESKDGWLDLLAQRPNAVLLRDGAMVVDLGLQSSTKHLALTRQSAWRVAESVDGRRAGLVVGKTAALDLPIDGELSPALHPETDGHPGLAMAITLRALAPEQAVTVLWNDRPLANLMVSSAWERRTFSLPPDLTHHGDNRLRLHFRRTLGEHGAELAAAVASVEIGTHERITAVPHGEPPPPFRVDHDDAGRPSLTLAAGTALAYYVRPPRRARLELDVHGKGVFEVLVSSSDDHRQGHAPTMAAQDPLRETGNHRVIDLSAWGDTPIRIELRTRSDRDAEAGARITAARVVAKRDTPLDRRTRKLRDLIVLAVEGARADELELGRRPPLPELEAFMNEALVFDRAYANSPLAIPSHASWLSSVPPPVHMTVRGTYVADGQTMLPEVLARAGHYRELVAANEDITADRGLTQGLDELRIVGGGHGQDDHGTAVVNEAVSRTQARMGRLFLMLDLADPLAPYEPTRDKLDDAVMPPRGPMAHLTHVWVGRVKLGKVVPDEKELAWVRRLYRGELQMVSQATGELLAFLRESHRLDDAIVVFMGVHGEEFLEHGSAGHGLTLYEESLRVPLAIRAPELVASGRIDAPVDLLDLAPTLVDLLGLPPAQAWQGESLVRIIDDPVPPPRLLVAYLGDGSKAGIVDQAKLWLGPGLSERFYDLSRDPGETQDLLADGGVALRIVRAAMAWQLAYADRWRRARWGTGAELRPAFAQDLGM
ncbi:MAG: sulfatase-like hydrolase/transferase [Deltaproteobacteria bacterium]|nr:sulfatase-like hydrolase/transferase [Deltaproteobacteria bacterium]